MRTYNDLDLRVGCTEYGCHPLSKAYRPDSEEPVITADKEKICHRCAEKYREAKAEAEKGRALNHLTHQNENTMANIA